MSTSASLGESTGAVVGLSTGAILGAGVGAAMALKTRLSGETWPAGAMLFVRVDEAMISARGPRDTLTVECGNPTS